MSLAFWISLIVCVGAFLEAVIDHHETLEDFRSSTGRARRWHGFKLWVYWVVFGLALISTLVTGWESLSTDKKIEGQAKDIRSTSNALHSATQELASVKATLDAKINPPFVVRLKNLFEAIDLKIMPSLVNGGTEFHGNIPDKQKQELQKLAAESDNAGLLVLKPDKNFMSVTPQDGTVVSVSFSVSTNFIKKLSTSLQELKKVGQRRLTDDEKRLAISLLQNVPKVQFNFGLNHNIEDSDELLKDLVDVLAGAGFRFCNAKWYTFSGARVNGIWVSQSSNPVITDAILKSFNAVGLNAKSGTRPNPGNVTGSVGGGYNGTVPCDEGETIAIEIGYK